MNKLIIGVPVREKNYESFIEMLKSLKESVNENTYDKLVIIDGGDMTQTKIALSTIDIKYELIKNPGTTPIAAYNFLFDLAKKEKSDLFLTQTDVLFSKMYKKDWLLKMKKIAQEKEIGAVTCTNGGGKSGNDYVQGLEWLGGWCSYFSFKAIEKIGGYDVNFPNPQYGVDVDHTYRLFKEGFKIVKMDYWVHHHMQNERPHDRDPETEINKKACAKFFREKWKLGEFKE